MKHLLKGMAIGAAIMAALMFAYPADAYLFCDGDNTNTVTWSVGQNTEAIAALRWDTGVECFATGAEVNYIEKNFLGLHTRRSGYTINWYGEDAMFIVGNLGNL